MKFVSTHSIPVQNDESRLYALSSNDKVDYIVSVLNDLGKNVEILSPSVTNKRTFFKSRKDFLNEKTIINSGFTVGYFGGWIKSFFSLMWLFAYLLKNTKRDEIIFAYHRVINIPFVYIAKKIKRFKLVLEVEEVYSDILLNHKFAKWRILFENFMFKNADAFVFASKQLETRCNKKNRPFAIANGSYIAEPVLEKPLNDGKIHLVYAGLIAKDAVAFRCLEIADLLPEKYVLHVIGYGKNQDIVFLRQVINSKNKKNLCKIIFDGSKRNEEYKRYLQKCHIGLCPLNSEKKFQSACFPSKVTSYLANGLRVVTTENEIIRSSSYGDIIIFSETEKSSDFAKAILSVDFSTEYDSRDKILKNNFNFKRALQKFNL